MLFFPPLRFLIRYLFIFSIASSKILCYSFVYLFYFFFYPFSFQTKILLRDLSSAVGNIRYCFLKFFYAYIRPLFDLFFSYVLIVFSFFFLLFSRFIWRSCLTACLSELPSVNALLVESCLVDPLNVPFEKERKERTGRPRYGERDRLRELRKLRKLRNRNVTVINIKITAVGMIQSILEGGKNQF